MSTHPGTILVVDDDRLNRTLMSVLLEEQGYSILTADGGRTALGLLATTPCDVVLLDLVMPDLDGFQVLAAIKASPALQHLPVIVISALDEMDSVVRCIEMGATDHLNKPVNPVLLRARLGASLSAKRLHDQEAEYLREVAALTRAAAAVEAGSFDPGELARVAARPDELGQLARVFSHMARQLRARELHLAEQNRVKSAFISRMTHELRSPFVSAGFSVQLLRRYADHAMFEELRGQLAQLERELTEGRRLIDGMIAFASMVSRGSQLRRGPVALPDLIRSASGHLESLAAAREVTLRYELPADMPTVSVDPDRLGEAIAHLVHNGIKFNHAGGWVTVSCWLADGQVALKVEDSGRGVAPEALAGIWEAFGQTADDERRGVEGLGLGLALVKQVVEARGGQVAAVSRPGVGSTFGFRLPLT